MRLLTTIKLAACRRPGGAEVTWGEVRLHGEGRAGQVVAEEAHGGQDARERGGSSRCQRAGVMNGIFLIALGAVWDKLRFSARQSRGLLDGTLWNLKATVLAAVFGTTALSLITSAGHHGQPRQEHLITIAFISVGVTIITCAVVVLVAARQPVPPQAAQRAS